MFASLRKNPLEKRSGRLELAIRKSPYFVRVTKGVRLGYYRGRTGGSWLVSVRSAASSYDTFRIGAADDVLEADGSTVLAFWDAHERARQLGQKHLAPGPHLERRDKYRVKDAVAEYLDEIALEKSAANVRGAQYVFQARILPELGDILVEELTTQRIKLWLQKIATSARLIRRKSTSIGPAVAEVADGDDARRKRRATANRILTCLKAALNLAFENERVSSDFAWRKIKPFKKVDVAIERYLDAEEQRALVNCCEPDFRRLVVAALLTGCRYSELCKLCCSDFDAKAKQIHVRRGKGNHRYVALTDEGTQLFCACVAKRPPTERIFVRTDRQPWKASQQVRRMNKASTAAALSRPANFHLLRHTYASQLAMRNVAMATIAKQLGHADTRITTKHYAHLSPDFVAKSVRENFPTIGFSMS